MVDDVIPEPLGGAHRDTALMAQRVKDTILKETEALEKLDTETRINKRIDKFSNMGVVA